MPLDATKLDALADYIEHQVEDAKYNQLHYDMCVLGHSVKAGLRTPNEYFTTWLGANNTDEVDSVCTIIESTSRSRMSTVGLLRATADKYRKKGAT